MVCGIALFLLVMMPAVTAVNVGANTDFNSTGAPDEDVNLSIMAKAPTAAFSAKPTSGLRPLTVTFTDSSKGNIISELWEYRLHPGSTWVTFSLNGSKTFSFTSAGIYDVRLTVSGDGGSSNETELSLYHRE